MKREEILLYLSVNKVRLYLVHANKEYILEDDTSLFFELGEISNEKLCEDFFTEIYSKLNLGFYYFKPVLHVLYNDVCYADLKFLYKCALKGIDYYTIDFVPLTKLVKKIRNDANTVVFDTNYYTLVDRGEKSLDVSSIDFEPIIIGKVKSDNIHYADEDILWNTLKSYFTNRKSYGIIEIGDD